MSETKTTHRELGETLDRLRVGVGASDLHGSLTGYLCGGGKASAKLWPEALELHAATDGWLDEPLFASLYSECREQLDDSELGFEPLLPSDDVALAQRADALVEWCRGFLGGIGLSGADRLRTALTPAAEEILRDFAAIAASNLDYGDDEEDESSLTEVLEFVRIGVLLLHSELDERPSLKGNSSAPSQSIH